MILPKEKAFVDLCTNHANKNEHTWIYTLLTKKHSPTSRLEDALTRAGLRVGVLRQEDADPREREAYIDKIGGTVDVMISHPQLVATGLDLFNHQRGYNFNNLAFYQTGYDLFAIRQASRRGWRMGQDRDCTVTYAYYTGTMQATAMLLMSRKMLAALQLEEGSISEEGLASMGKGGSDQVALINAISNAVDPKDIERNWGKSRGGTGKLVVKPKSESKPKVYIEEDEEWEDELPKVQLDCGPAICQDECPELPSCVNPEDDDEPEFAEDCMDFDEDDLAAMFKNIKEGSGDVLDW